MQDEKITELYINYGYAGTGLFFAILEKIAFAESPVSEKILLFQLQIKGKKLMKIYSFLFETELLLKKKGEVFNEKVLEVSKKYQTKKESVRKRVSEWRDNQECNKNVTLYKKECNADVTPLNKTKLNKTKLNKEEKVLFFDFWDKFHLITKKPKTDKENTEKYWKKLKGSEKQKAYDNIEKYSNTISDKKYIKKARTYLSDKNFNDEFQEARKNELFTHVIYKFRGMSINRMTVARFEQIKDKVMQNQFEYLPEFINAKESDSILERLFTSKKITEWK